MLGRLSGPHRSLPHPILFAVNAVPMADVAGVAGAAKMTQALGQQGSQLWKGSMLVDSPIGASAVVPLLSWQMLALS